MSHVDDLVQELCASGVPFRPLGEIGTFARGRRFTKADRVDVGIPSIHYGEIYTDYGVSATAAISHVRPELRPVLRFAQPGDVVVAGVGETVEDVGKSVAWLGAEPVAVHDDCFIFRSALDPKYVAYYLQTAAFNRPKQAIVARAKVKRLSSEGLARLSVPVPPLEVQREIVRVLDDFHALQSNLEQKLQAELVARRHQYSHYRNQLLTFRDEGNVRWSPIGEVAEVRSGWGFPNAEQGIRLGDYPFYKVSDMNLPGNEIVMQTANNYIDGAAARRLGVSPAPAGTTIFPKIGAAVATNKKRLLSQASAYDNNVMGVIPGPEVESGFLFHLMQTLDLAAISHASGAVPSIRKTDMARVLVPVPPRDEQRRIVALLDSFGALVSELSTGLQAELGARRQQYGGYRERLMTFQETA